MGINFHALASGSAGNASLLDVDGRGVLIDLGLKPRPLGQRLRAVGAGWGDVRAALLTHTHGDHWQAATLAELLRRDIPLHCHPDHARVLTKAGDDFAALRDAGLVHFYDLDSAWPVAAGCTCRAFEVRHDGGVTCGFRFEGPAGMFGPWALAYASDLGSWDAETVRALVDVDVLALEFNHDVARQRGCGRPYFLVRRVLGDHGHLSNIQAGQLLDRALDRSEPGRLQHLVLLHLSRDCNTPELAIAAAEAIRHPDRDRFHIHAAAQDVAGPSLRFERSAAPRRRPARPRLAAFMQPMLPGWE